MFWALAQGRVDPRGFDFVHSRADTEALNRAAEDPDAPHVSAVSVHQYAYLADRWLLLPHGGSMGDGYGPVLVTTPGAAALPTPRPRIGVPGVRTTAYLALRLLIGEFEPVIIPVTPLSRVFEAVEGNEVDAALVIHEGRLLYEARGLRSLLDLGAAWRERFDLPLPLGANVIRKSLGPETIRAVSSVLRESIAWALAHRDEVIDALLGAETRPDVPRDRAMLDRYLAMYANQDTFDWGAQGRRAIADLLERGHAAGIIPHLVVPEYAP
jgi:1,4-dihydroxy-6-naphthoate synthase